MRQDTYEHVNVVDTRFRFDYLNLFPHTVPAECTQYLLSAVHRLLSCGISAQKTMWY